ncbi:MAG: histidine phosphatase family protein [Colwellia sp.]
MKLYIMRHGEAKNEPCFTQSGDAQRELTKQGRFEAMLMGKCLAGNVSHLTNIYVSPYIRAQQTCTSFLTDFLMASKISTETNSPKQLEPITLDFITPSGDADKVHDFIDGLLVENAKVEQNNTPKSQSTNDIPEISDIKEPAFLIISHMPLVSFLVAALTKGQSMPIFSTAAIVEIDYDMNKMQGTLVKMMSPLDLF